MIACEILYREICWCVARSQNVVDVKFLRKGLHDVGEKEMSKTLQAEIDQVQDKKYQGVLLAYGLCNNGIRGLTARTLPLVVPRAHDCITLLLGSKERYQSYFEQNPGTYFHSTGWMERDVPDEDEKHIMSQLGLNKTFQEYKNKYGEDNARYIMEVLGKWQQFYNKLTYIDMGIGDFKEYEELSQKEAEEKNWKYERLRGDIRLLQRLLDGQWNAEDFLVIPPGNRIVPSYDENIIRSQEIDS